MIAPASTHRTCNRCLKLLHRDQFRPKHGVCKPCQNGDNIVNLRSRRRTDLAYRERERASDRRRKLRQRDEARADAAWRKAWAQRTIAGLHEAGWSYRGIARAAGIHKNTILRWAHGTAAYVYPTTFARIWRWVGDLRWDEERAGGGSS